MHQNFIRIGAYVCVILYVVRTYSTTYYQYSVNKDIIRGAQDSSHFSPAVPKASTVKRFTIDPSRKTGVGYSERPILKSDRIVITTYIILHLISIKKSTSKKSSAIVCDPLRGQPNLGPCHLIRYTVGELKDLTNRCFT